MCGWFAFILSSLIYTSVCALTQTKYVLLHSNSYKPLYVNDSLILELTNEVLDETPRKYMHAAVSVVTDSSKRLLVHFISLDIAFDNSKPDRLHLFDYLKNGKPSKITPVQGLFGIYDPYYRHTSSGVKDYISTKNKLRFDYMGRPSLLYNGFRILVTAFKDQNDKGNCERDYFKCSRKSICTPISVMCDGQLNCGEEDTSDERNCKLIYTTDLEVEYAIKTAAVVCGISITTFLLVIGITACFLMKLNRRKCMRQQSVQVLAKKSSNGNWLIANDMGLAAAYAPPTYEDVVRAEEDPPPAYHTLAKQGVKKCSSSNNKGSSENNITVVCIETRGGTNADISLCVTCTHVQPCTCVDSESSNSSQNDAISSNSIQSDFVSAQSEITDSKDSRSNNSMSRNMSKNSLPMNNVNETMEYLNNEDDDDL